MKTVSFARILLAISLGLGVHAIGLAQDSDRDAAADEEGAPEALPGLPTLQRLNTPLSALTLPTRAAAPTVFDKMPPDKSDGLFAGSSANASRGTRRPWAPACVRWTAPEYWHHPLYFEDAPLERYGQAWNPRLQPATSAVRFYSTLFVLPYKYAITRPWECVPNLGYCRPGAPTRPMRESLPWDRRAALAECLIVTGVAVAVP